MTSGTDESASLIVLRENGPMTLRDLTAATANRMGFSLMYAEVDGVMRRHLDRGQAACDADAEDYRRSIWRAAA